MLLGFTIKLRTFWFMKIVRGFAFKYSSKKRVYLFGGIFFLSGHM